MATAGTNPPMRRKTSPHKIFHQMSRPKLPDISEDPSVIVHLSLAKLPASPRKVTSIQASLQLYTQLKKGSKEEESSLFECKQELLDLPQNTPLSTKLLGTPSRAYLQVVVKIEENNTVREIQTSNEVDLSSLDEHTFEPVLIENGSISYHMNRGLEFRVQETQWGEFAPLLLFTNEGSDPLPEALKKTTQIPGTEVYKEKDLNSQKVGQKLYMEL